MSHMQPNGYLAPARRQRAAYHNTACFVGPNETLQTFCDRLAEGVS